MNIHDASTIHEVVWPDTREGRFARQYCVPLVHEGTARFTSDRVDLRIVTLDEHVFPIAINDGGRDNSSSCSVFGRYVRIPATALPRLDLHPAMRLAMRGVLGALGALLRAGAVEKCIYVGNGLLVRGLEPMLTASQVARLTEQLVAAFPDHALVFGAINPVTHSVLLNNLAASGYSFLFASHTRMWLPHQAAGSAREYKRRRDARRLEGSGYEVVDGAGMVQHAARLAALYKALNRDKYSTNARVDEAFFELALREGFMGFRLLAKGARIDGFIGYALLHDVLIAPLCGYDPDVPQSAGLYPILSALTMQEAMAHGVVLETGAGADEFKSHRGDVPVARYGAFFVDHLPAHRRAAWQLLQRYANGPFAASTRQYLAGVDGDAAAGMGRIPAVFAPPCELPAQAAAGLGRAIAALADEVASAGAPGDAAIAGRIAALEEKLRRWPYAGQLVEAPRARLARLEQHVRETRARAQQVNAPAHEVAGQLLARATRVGQTALVIGAIDGARERRLRAIASEVRGQAGARSVAVLLASASDGKQMLLCSLSQDLLERGLSARALLEAILPAAGKCGGEAALAWGGGREPGAIGELLDAGQRWLAQRVAAG